MTKSKTLIISQPDPDFLMMTSQYQQEIIDLVNQGYPGVILYFQQVNHYPLEFIDELFSRLIAAKGVQWLVKSRIMVNADNDELKDQISDYVLEMLKTEMEKTAAEPVLEVRSITIENWQKLPVIIGRIATEEDVNSDNAVFFLNQDYGIAKHIDMLLPQCAIYTNESGKEIPVIVVQAEELDGTRLVGMYTLEGQKIVGDFTDIELIDPELFFGMP